MIERLYLQYVNMFVDHHLANGKCRNRMNATMQDKRISVARVKYASAL